MDTYEYGINGSLPSRKIALADFDTVTEFLNNVLNGTVTGFSLAGFFQNNSDYIVGIKFFPIDAVSFIRSGSISNYIFIGSQSAPTTKTVRNVGTWKNCVNIFNVRFSRHFNNFLDFEPYTRIRVFVPYFGFVDIPCEEAYNGDPVLGLSFWMAVDFSTGNATLYVYNVTNYHMVTTKTAKLSIDVPMGKSNAEEQQRNRVLHGIQTGTTIAMLVAGAATGNPLLIGGAIAAGGKALTNALNDNISRLQSYDGGTGGTDSLAVRKTCQKYIERPSDAYKPSPSVLGRPCRQTLSLSALSGYTKVGTIHFEPLGEPIYQDEIEEIVGLLQKGVYL